MIVGQLEGWGIEMGCLSNNQTPGLNREAKETDLPVRHSKVRAFVPKLDGEISCISVYIYMYSKCDKS